MSWKRRVRGGVLGFIGFVLSPLSWWNDLFVNIPLALGLAWGVAWLWPAAFEPSFIVGYWLTNVIGLVLLSRGAKELLAGQPSPYSRRELLKDLVVALLYTLLIVVLLKLNVLRPVQDYFRPASKSGFGYGSPPMKPKTTLTLLACWAAAFLCSAAPAVNVTSPNIILLLADDLGYGELGCQGNPQIPTPHIDSIARNGVRFTQAYVTAPNCSPSRAGLFTGRIPTRFGYEFNPTGARNDDPGTGLPPAERTLAERLHDVGYTTGLIGKWHLGGASDYHPQRHGFDEFFGFLHEGHFYVPPPWEGVATMLRRKALPGNAAGRWLGDNLVYSTHMGHDEPAYDANNPILRGSQPVEERAYLTDAFTREAADFIARHADKPFFLLLAYNAVHSPLQAADRYVRRFAHLEDIHRRIFAAMLANLDDSVGTILERVRAEKLEPRTLIVFLSDNGGPTRELTSSNAPLRGEKGSMYEGGLRVPCLMQMPGTLPAGKVEDRWIVSVDLTATVAALAGAALPTDSDGVNLMPFLIGQDQRGPHDNFFWRQGPRTALRQGDWKLVGQQRGGRWEWELFNLADDLSESDDRAKAEPARLAALQRLWEARNAEMREPLFGGR